MGDNHTFYCYAVCAVHQGKYVYFHRFDIKSMTGEAYGKRYQGPEEAAVLGVAGA